MASTSFADHLDLGKVGLALNGFERRKGRFRAFTYRLEYPKVSVSIFKSGKVNFNGAKDIASITWAYKKISLGFKRVGIEVYDNSPIIISNMVAVYNMKKELNLPYIAMTLGLENVEYTPEFPDLVYRIEEPKVSMMLFASGKIICTGAKKESDIVDGIRIMRKTLKKANVM
jgi:transcription initiation factor TFIID TATA-box-binding protein